MCADNAIPEDVNPVRPYARGGTIQKVFDVLRKHAVLVEKPGSTLGDVCRDVLTALGVPIS